MANHPHALERRLVVSKPIVEQVIEHWIELLLWRIPGLEEVVVEADRVDGPNSRVGVSVGRQEDALGVGEKLDRLLEQVDTCHSGHAVIGQKQGCLISAQLELTQGLQGSGAGLGTQYTEAVGVLPTQGTCDGVRNRGIVIDGQQNRLVHDECPGAQVSASYEVLALQRGRTHIRIDHNTLRRREAKGYPLQKRSLTAVNNDTAVAPRLGHRITGVVDVPV